MEETATGKGLERLRENAGPRHVRLLSQLQRSESHRRVIEWPGVSDLKVQLVALNNTEVQLAKAAAWQRFKDLGLDVVPVLAEEWSAEEVTQRLFRGIRTVEDPDRLLFDSADELRSLTTEAARFEVWQELDELEQQTASDFGNVTPDKLREIEEAIKKKDAAQLRSFGRHMLAAYLLITDDPQSFSPTGRSTPGQESAASNSSPESTDPTEESAPAEQSTPTGE